MLRLNELLYKGLVDVTPFGYVGMNVYLLYLALTSKMQSKVWSASCAVDRSERRTIVLSLTHSTQQKQSLRSDS